MAVSANDHDAVDRAVEAAARAVRDSDALVVAAGAGMGVDSGLPDYRGDEGFWNAYPPYRGLGLDYMRMARPKAFLTDPELAWGFWGHQLALYRGTAPHDGFRTLLEWGRGMVGGCFVVTTNVDGQFRKAGFDPLRIHECHGSVHRLQCVHPCSRDVWPADGADVEVDMTTMRASPPLPRCRNCGAIARPNVYMFGDFGYVWEASGEQAERFRAWLSENRMRTIAVVECGAGTAVPGLRRFCEELAANLPCATLVRINPREHAVPAGTAVSVPLRAADALTRIASALSR